MNKTKVVIIPGGFQYVKNYGIYDGIDIWLKNSQQKEKEILNSDYIVAHSAGVNFALTLENLEKYNFIFINPLIKKRSFLNLIIRDIVYLFSKIDDIKMDKIVPISNWFYALKKAYRLTKIEVLKEIKKIPKEKIIIIRGKNDNYFCDKESVEILKNNNFTVIEVEAGHDWNENIAETVNKIINKI